MNSSNHATASDAFQSRILQEVSRSFALTIPQLPALLSRPVANAYLICRIADTIEDDAKLTIEQKEQFYFKFNGVLGGDVPAREFAEQLSPLLSETTASAEHELIRNTPEVIRIFEDLNEIQQAEIRRCIKTMSYGMLRFQKLQSSEGLDSLSQMNDYCYYVAGVVGEMLTGLFCDYSEAIERQRRPMMSLAASFGQGLQMTNIMKDIWEDKARGACWFPNDLFREAGFDLAALRAGNADPAFGDGLQSLIGLAHGHLRNALSYTLYLPRHETGIRKFCIWAVGMAIGTLQKINVTRRYGCARDVTISRTTLRRIVMASNATIRSNVLLRVLFQIAARGLPLPENDAARVPENPAENSLHNSGGLNP